MSTFRPKYITFDCYGTLIRFRMGDMARELFPDRIAPHIPLVIRAAGEHQRQEFLG